MKSLVVYYTRTGTTKKAAELIAEKLKADLEEIVDTKDRKGIKGWLLSGKDASTKAKTKIKDTKKDPSKYDLVIVGTPIWAGNIPPAIRTYLDKNRIKKSAFFCTCGSSHGRAFSNMLELIIDTKLVGKLPLKTKEVRMGAHKKIDDFIAKLK